MHSMASYILFFYNKLYKHFYDFDSRKINFSVTQVDEVKPLRLKRGEPQLTMASIFNLEDLAPFFAAICNGVTRQQTKGWSTTSTRVGGGAMTQVGPMKDT